ncbi:MULTISPECIES: STAS domain-containing protein [unclassified Mycobacterium]|uniref:STAS domain-containing protein n=1 Tax=unclassified Mycobacterium TaxID=2642494 RepID=UPI0029C82DD6|nr:MULTISPECIES: STAS domain-containing protein [unclassified Mycobacterium]
MNEPNMADDDQSPSQQAFAVDQSRIAGAVVLSVRGDIDALTAPHLTDAMLAALPEPPSAVIVDLSDVDFLASAGMTALVTANERTAPGVRFLVVADGSGTSRPLKLMGLDRVLALYPTLDEAVRALS